MIDIKMLALLRTTFTASTLILLTTVVALADGSDGVGGQPCALKMFSVTGAGLPSLCWA